VSDSADPSDPGFDARLFARVRREGPSEALRHRILVQGRAEISRAEQERHRIVPRSGKVTVRRACFGALLACAVAGAGLVWFSRTGEERVSITAENTAPHSSEPRARVPEPSRGPDPVVPAAPPLAPHQNAAARTPTVQRGAARATLASPKSAAPALEIAPPLPSLAEQVEHIKRARTALRAGESERALLVLDEYQNGRAGELAAEARLLRIEALAQAGRKAEAASEARRFATDFPTSPLIDRAQSFAGE
jgi:hypothetical protein